MGEHRWLTLVSQEGADGVELLLEPMGFPEAREYYKFLYESGIPVAQFESEDLDAEVGRLKSVGVSFKEEMVEMGEVRFVIMDDTCGNLICLAEKVLKG